MSAEEMNPDVAYEREMARKKRLRRKAEKAIKELEAANAGLNGKPVNIEIKEIDVDKAPSDAAIVRRDPRGHPGAENMGDHPRRCTAHKKNGDRCGHYAIQGGTICGYHGGNNPAVKAKARARLESAADIMAAELLKMAQSGNIKDGVKLSAVKDALDRAGLTAKTAVSVDVGMRPFEEVIWDSISSVRPAELRPLGDSAPAELEPSTSPEVLDCEVVEQPLPPPSINQDGLEPRTHPIRRARFQQTATAEDNQMLSYEQAVGEAARVRPPGPRRRR